MYSFVIAKQVLLVSPRWPLSVHPKSAGTLPATRLASGSLESFLLVQIHRGQWHLLGFRGVKWFYFSCNGVETQHSSLSRGSDFTGESEESLTYWPKLTGTIPIPRST